MKKSFIKTFLFIVACALIGGILGVSIAKFINRNGHVTNYVSLNKLDALLNLVSSKYVEEVDEEKLIEKLIPQVLKELDPHSTYISAEELEKSNEDISGSFSGVGIQFNIREDTIRVVAVVNGGPAEKAGMRAGDRIVSVNDSSFVGSNINNDKVMKTLRGKKGSKVEVGVERNFSHEVLTYTLTRDDIPVTSVDAHYKIKDNIAYLKVGSFSRTTYNEFLSLINKMKTQEKCDRIILDLRGNPGGLMGSALAILNELLPKNSLMLYVEGKSYPRENSYSDGRGSFQDMPIVILMDEWSASASEIVAGAIQDNDRGYIVGRRSFGKGLVQQQIPFRDGSAIRLTVAHYYIPSGRNIQKPYEKGSFENYEMDLTNRYLHGEFESMDSIQVNDSLRFETINGRTVYGGGGIMPDYFVPLDTTGNSIWLTNIVNKNLIYLFAASYADHHREALSQCKTLTQLERYLDAQSILKQFLVYSKQKGISGNRDDIKTSGDEVETQIYSYIARNILGEDAFWEKLQQDDKTLLKAIELISDLGTQISSEDHR